MYDGRMDTCSHFTSNFFVHAQCVNVNMENELRFPTHRSLFTTPLTIPLTFTTFIYLSDH